MPRARKPEDGNPFDFTSYERRLAETPDKKLLAIDAELEPTRKLCRLSARIALLQLRAAYPKQFNINGKEVESRLLLDYAGGIVADVLGQCWNADVQTMVNGGRPRYLATGGMFADQQARREIHCLAWYRLMKHLEGKAPFSKAHKEGNIELAVGKELARLARQLRRNGCSVPHTRWFLLGHQFSDWNFTPYQLAELEKALHDTTSHSGQRPLTRDRITYLMGVWMPLRLWECPKDGQEAFERIRKLDQDIGRQIAPFAATRREQAKTDEIWRREDVATSESKPDSTFVTALANVRNRYLKPGRDAWAELAENSG